MELFPERHPGRLVLVGPRTELARLALNRRSYDYAFRQLDEELRLSPTRLSCPPAPELRADARSVSRATRGASQDWYPKAHISVARKNWLEQSCSCSSETLYVAPSRQLRRSPDATQRQQRGLLSTKPIPRGPLESVRHSRTMTGGVRRAFAYLRVSTTEQSNNGLSLDAQRARLCESASASGYRVERYFTDSISGGASPEKRPGLSDALRRLRAGEAHPGRRI